MGGKILVLKGASQYGVLRYAADLLIKEWRKIGLEAEVIDLLHEDKISKSRFENVRFIFSLQALLLNNEAFVRDCTDLYLGWIVDTPAKHKPRIEGGKERENIHIVCIDQTHADYINKYYRPKGYSYYMPHGGFTAIHTTEYADREIEVFCPGSFAPYSAVEEKIEKLPEVFRNICYEAISLIMENQDLSPQEAVLAYLDAVGVGCNEEEALELEFVYQHVEDYMRNCCREKLVCELAENDIKVTVTGKGWERLQCSKPENIVVLSEEGIEIQEAVEYIAKSKVCLNLLPSYPQGLHERLLTAMLNHTICVAVYNHYASQLFPEDEAVLYYKFGQEENLTEKIKAVLVDDALGERVTERAYELVKGKHTWEQRAHDIIALGKQIQPMQFEDLN